MPTRILLVEDDPVSRDLLSSVLHARGYAVDVAADGFPGLRLLKEQTYDLVLIDYHLPDLDGYAAARLMRDAGGNAPKLVAITADRHGLMARSGADAVFDAILTKPIEPQRLFRFIETLLDISGEHAAARAAAKAFLRDPQHEQARAAAEAFWRDRGLAGRPKAYPVPEPTPEQALALSFCFDNGKPEDADLIVLLDGRALELLPAVHERSSGRPTPVIDITGHALEACNAAFRLNDPSSWSEIASLLQRYRARSAQLTASARSVDPDTRLLAYLFVAERTLRVLDPPRQTLIQSGGWLIEPDARLAAERLSSRGFLVRRVEDCRDGREFVYGLTETASAFLTQNGPEPNQDDRSSPEAVRVSIERTVSEASRAFAQAMAAATEAASTPAHASHAKTLAALDRLFAQSVCDVAAHAAETRPTVVENKPSGKAAEPSTSLTHFVRRRPASGSHDVQAFLDLIEPSDQQPASAPKLTGEPKRILLVDDVDVNREIACAMLQANGHAVDAVASGAEAVAAVRARPYSLVFMDVQMPGMDGFEATRRIRALPSPHRHVPIVGMSASSGPDQIAAFNAAGMNDHVVKPIRREDLTAAVERWRRFEADAETALDRDVYDGLLDLVGRERVSTLLDRLAAQLSERFVGAPASDEDRARLAGDAHAMVSAAGGLGFSALSDACRSLEAACAAGENIAAHLNRVRACRAAALKAVFAVKQAA